MAKPKTGFAIVLSPEARQDIRELLFWSHKKFGPDAAKRYRELLFQALRDLEEDPLRPGSRTRPELDPTARTYHLQLSRRHVEGKRVQSPRHFILYRVTPAGLQIGRILHDNREFVEHIPADFTA